MTDNQGVAASPPGLRPYGAEPASQSQAEPLVPNAGRGKWTTFHLRLDRDLHDRIGKSSKRHGRTMTNEILARLERVS